MMYESINDMPIFNWFKCIESDYKYAMIDYKKFTDKLQVKCLEAFQIVYKEYIDHFGVSDQLKDIVSLENEILCMKIDLALTNDIFINTMIDLKVQELEAIKKVKPSKTNSAKIAVEKWLSFRINEKETTVKEFYDYLNELQNGG